MELPTVYVCNVCNKSYDKANSYHSHMRSKHNENSAGRNVRCTQDNCSKTFFTINNYREHLSKDHAIVIDVKTIGFLTENHFFRWKKDHEQETNERYVQNTGAKNFSYGKCLIFDCHRSGFEKKKPLLESERTEALQGSSKINSRCPAQMILFEKLGAYELTFYGTHTHQIQVEYVDLSEKTCEIIAGMLKGGFSDEHILNYFKTKPANHRDRFVDERDIKRIANRY